jgi:predicted Zn-dependent protease
MEVQKITNYPSLFYRFLAYKLILAMSLYGSGSVFAAGQVTNATGDVSVQGDSAALQNLGRAVQSPEARSSNLPLRPQGTGQPTFVLPDMGDPGGDSLSRLDERKYGEMIMRQIRPDSDYSNDYNWAALTSRVVEHITLKYSRLKIAVLTRLHYLVALSVFILAS